MLWLYLYITNGVIDIIRGYVDWQNQPLGASWKAGICYITNYQDPISSEIIFEYVNSL